MPRIEKKEGRKREIDGKFGKSLEMIFHYLSDNRILYRKGLLRVAVIDGD